MVLCVVITVCYNMEIVIKSGVLREKGNLTKLKYLHKNEEKKIKNI